MKTMFKWTAVSQWLFFSLIILLFSFSSAIAAPEVNVMPSGDTAETAYAWSGNPLIIWGNVRGGTGPYTYEWDINNNGTPDYSAAVSNVNDIAISHAYASAGVYDAELTVTDSLGDSGSAIVRIRVLPSMTKEAQIELAIERGLKWLYLRQIALGNGMIYNKNSYDSRGAETSAAVLAFENRNHKPCTRDLNTDGVVDALDRAIWEKDNIYAETVHKGLDFLISTLASRSVAAPYDSNGNGVYIADYYYPYSSYRGPYKIGMYMMALVGAGDIASGAPDLVATTGPAGVMGKTYRVIVEDMVDYCDYAQYHGSSYGGGWIYGPGGTANGGDNSASQWPAIGMEAAEFGWGVFIRQAIKDLNYQWIEYSQRFTPAYTPGSTYYGGLGYRSASDPAHARTASGICQLSFQGKPKTDPRIVAAGEFLDKYKIYWRGEINYTRYAIAKGARIAKIDTNSDGIGDTYSEIQKLGNWDWYDEYSTDLISSQRADGSWLTDNTYFSYTLDTAWAVEILTKNVFTLRPVPNIVASPNPALAGADVDFDISGSSHQDSTKLLTTWAIDFDNDGIFDQNGSFPAPPITLVGGFADTGVDYTANVLLRVTDNVGDIGDKIISVAVSSGNVPPVADPGGPYQAVVGKALTLDGSASFDPNAGQGIPGDTIVSWEWDLDGDGQYDDATGETPTYTWNLPQTVNVGLKVTDDAGLFNTASVYTEVFVVDLWPENYVRTSVRRISRFVYEYSYQFDMRNSGNATAANVRCTLDSWPAQMTVVDGFVSFGDIAGPDVVTSGDTFTFRVDRRYPIANPDVRWKLEYEDVSDETVIFIDFPLL